VEIFWMFPMEIAKNPNLSMEHIDELLTDICSNRLENKARDTGGLGPRKGFAILWSFLENPALPMIRLENPAHPIFEQIEKTLRLIRYRTQIATLTKEQLGFALCQAWKQWLPLVKRYNADHYRTWLYHLSGLWRRMNKLAVPEHYGFSLSTELHLRGYNHHPIADTMEKLRLSLSNLTKKAYASAFETLWETAISLLGTSDYHEEILKCLDEVSLGKSWPDPALEELLGTHTREKADC
jgi:hypothetical protein